MGWIVARAGSMHAALHLKQKGCPDAGSLFGK
jgi:hypothetical protein